MDYSKYDPNTVRIKRGSDEKNYKQIIDELRSKSISVPSRYYIAYGKVTFEV